MKRPSRFLHCSNGASAVEFAILAPVFLFMLFGLMAYAIYFAASHSVQQLAAGAARIAVSGLDDAERERIVMGYVRDHASVHPMLDAARLSTSVAASPSDAQQYVVSIQYDAANLPIWNLGIPLPASRIAFSSTVMKGGIR